MNLDQARAERDEGMARVAEKADESVDFAANADAFLEGFATSCEVFPAFQVVSAHEAVGLPQPHDTRAWGPVFMRAIKRKLIERVGYVQHPERHASPCPLYRSNVYRSQP